MNEPLLTLGGLDLTTEPFHALAEGAGFGAPVPLTSALPRLLLDGEIVSGSRSSNRTITFLVEVSAADAVELAGAEALLVTEVEKPRNTLTWSPPDGFGPTTVFDTFRGQVVQRFDDFEETTHTRLYEVTVPALPFGRSVDKVTETYSPVTSPTLTTVDACDSTANWSAPGGILTVQTSGGRTYLELEFSPSNGTTVDYTQTVTFDNYLVLEAFSAGPSYGSNGVSLRLNGAWIYASATESLGDNWYRYYFRTPTGSTGKPSFTFMGTEQATNWWRLDNLAKSAALAASGVYLLEPKGSARAVTSLQISNANPLQSVIVYAAPDVGAGYHPTDDWSALPAGAYAVFVRRLGGLGWSVGDTLTAEHGGQSAASRIKTLDSVIPVGVLHLGGDARPGASLPAPVITVKRNGTAMSSGQDYRAYLFRMGDDCSLTILHGLTTQTHLWIDQPSVAQPFGGIYAGTTADGSNAASVLDKAAAWDYPVVAPPRTGVYLLTFAAGGQPTSLTLEYHPAWHTNAAL